ARTGGYGRAMLRNLLAAGLAAAAVLTVSPGAASAANLDPHIDIGRPGDQYVVRGDVVLRPGEQAHRIAVVDGDITVPRGATVTDDVLSVDGTVRIAGTVRGHVVTVGGRALVARTGVVGNGITYGSDAPVLVPGAQVHGDVKKIDVHVGRLAPFISGVLWWIAMSVSTLVLGLLALLLAPRAADATFARTREGWGPAIGIGCAVFFGLPILALIALVTLVGIPFGIGLLLALLPLGALGYVTSAWLVGRRLHSEGRTVAFLIGWGILRGLALIPLLGALVFLCAVVFGLGALSWTLLRARDDAPPGAVPPVAGGPEAPTAPAI
ncbi:MAG TPA: hypothetical protein VLV15_14255, partial [Dongiaceae bacterium]|nr:hypothetical protein [Dongiaceae bacterium]